MEPKNRGLEDDFPFQSGDFQVPCCQFSWVYTFFADSFFPCFFFRSLQLDGLIFWYKKFHTKVFQLRWHQWQGAPSAVKPTLKDHFFSPSWQYIREFLFGGGQISSMEHEVMFQMIVP